MNSSSSTVSDAQIKRRLKELEAHERIHAVARAQMAAANAFIDEGQMVDAEVRLAMAIQLSSKAADFALLARAALKLASVARPPTAKQLARELEGALVLDDWPDDLKREVKSALNALRAKIPAPIEYRKCNFCSHQKMRSEFSSNQWLK
eukprot:54390-Prymnesium_polylepis.1